MFKDYLKPKQELFIMFSRPTLDMEITDIVYEMFIKDKEIAWKTF